LFQFFSLTPSIHIKSRFWFIKLPWRYDQRKTFNLWFISEIDFFGKILKLFFESSSSQKKRDLIWLTELYYYLNQNFTKKNLTLIINILIENDYPLKFISFYIIIDRIRNIQYGGIVVHDRINKNKNEESRIANIIIYSILYSIDNR